MDYQLAAELQPDLLSGERLQWTGQPRRGLLLRRSDLFIIPFTLVWFGFAVFWMIMAIRSNAPVFFILFGVPFVLIGALVAFGRFFIDAGLRRKTIYGLTNERLLIRSGYFKSSLQSFNLRTLTQVAYTERKDGSGTINLGTGAPVNFGNSANWLPRMSAAASFDTIPDVRDVYNKIIELQRGL